MKKTITISLFAFIGLSNLVNAQVPNWAWAKSAGGTDRDGGISVSTDAGGNVFMTGVFSSPTITFGTTTLTNADNPRSTNDIFLVKYNAAGNVLWAKSAGGNSQDYGNSVSTDAGGNVFVTGHFSSDTITFGTTSLTNAGDVDIFIVKYSASGNVLWAKSAGGNDYDDGSSVSTDAGGNVFMTGWFRSPTITFGTTTLTNASTNQSADIFIVKYDASGNVLWAKRAGRTSEDGGQSVSTDASGNVFMTGRFDSKTITFGTTNLTNASTNQSADIFIVKYDAAGNVLWAKSAGGTNYDVGSSVSTDAGGNVFVMGSFTSDTITFGTTNLTNASTNQSADIFIVKYDAAGNVLWAKSAGGTSYDWGTSVSTDAGGNVSMTGYFQSATITFGTTTLTNADTNYTTDIFIVKYNAVGNVLWAKSAGGTKDDRGIGVSTDAGGDVFMTGSFRSDTITFGTTSLTNAGYGDIFIAKLSGTTGIEEITNASHFQLYPNPTTSSFTIQYNGVVGRETNHGQELTVYNVLGEVVYKDNWLPAQTQQTINIAALPKGLYIVRIGERAERVVVE